VWVCVAVIATSMFRLLLSAFSSAPTDEEVAVLSKRMADLPKPLCSKPDAGVMGHLVHWLGVLLSPLLCLVSWLVCWVMGVLCVVLGGLVGTHVYVNWCARLSSHPMLAVVWHCWCASVFLGGLLGGGRAGWLWFQGGQRSPAEWLLNTLAPAIMSIMLTLHQGAKAAADLHEKCKDRTGVKLAVWSRSTISSGVRLFAGYAVPMFCWLLYWVLSTTIGTWPYQRTPPVTAVILHQRTWGGPGASSGGGPWRTLLHCSTTASSGDWH
jgi:hypothetical protein